MMIDSPHPVFARAPRRAVLPASGAKAIVWSTVTTPYPENGAWVGVCSRTAQYRKPDCASASAKGVRTLNVKGGHSLSGGEGEAIVTS